MALYNRIILRKLRRLFHRVPRLLKMVSAAPEIDGLFYEESYGFANALGWYSLIRNNPLTSDCQVIKVGWYKMRKGVEHEFLRFDISSPDNQHTSIVIAERSGGGVRSPDSDATQAADTLAQTDTTVDATASPLTPPETSALSPDVGDPTASSADESGPPLDKKTNTAQFAASFSSSSKRDACDRVYFATRISAAGDRVEEMCDRPRLVCTLSFTGAKPTANELATLLYVTSTQEPKHNLHDTQCHWFAATVFDALNILYEGAEQDPTPHQAGTICGGPVDFKASGEEVYAKYRDARAALAEKIEQQRRLKQGQEEQRQREREQRQAAEEAAKRAEEQREAAEQERQKEREQREAAEERARAAEEEGQRERLAAEEAAQKERAAEERARTAQEEIAKLLQEVEGLKRAGASTQQA
ncbi:hypothetical protein BKA82DRAFT_4048847 [Pisolithus tinctorius]|nr:hypothetical protein BKA82DRAFT_4048847 [Pisolithus tinctorius]